MTPRSQAPCPACPLATTDEVAAYLRVAAKTVRNWRSRGEGPPAVLVGGAVRYPLAGIEAWLASRPEQRPDDR